MRDEQAYNATRKRMERNLFKAAAEAEKLGHTVTAQWLFRQAVEIRKLNRKKGL